MGRLHDDLCGGLDRAVRAGDSARGTEPGRGPAASAGDGGDVTVTEVQTYLDGYYRAVAERNDPTVLEEYWDFPASCYRKRNIPDASALRPLIRDGNAVCVLSNRRVDTVVSWSTEKKPPRNQL